MNSSAYSRIPEASCARVMLASGSQEGARTAVVMLVALCEINSVDGILDRPADSFGARILKGGCRSPSSEYSCW